VSWGHGSEEDTSLVGINSGVNPIGPGLQTNSVSNWCIQLFIPFLPIWKWSPSAFNWTF